MTSMHQRNNDYSQTVTIKNNGTLPFEIELKGVLLRYNKIIYLTLPHLGLDVEEVEFNGKNYSEFKYSHWSENIIIVIDKDDILRDQYIFGTFNKKCIDSYGNKYNIGNSPVRWNTFEYLNVNMMINNPEILNYKMTFDGDKPKMGEPLYFKNKLCGIGGRVTNDGKVYVLPITFIIKSIDNESNELYFTDSKNIKSIRYGSKNYNVYDELIYSPELNLHVKLDTMLLYWSNEKRKILINNDINQYIKFKKKSFVKNNTNLLHWTRLFNEDVMNSILENFDTRDKKTIITLNKKKFKFVY